MGTEASVNIVTGCIKVVDTFRAAKLPRPARWRAAISELLALQNEYAAWLEALPDPVRDTPTGEALQAIVELDLDEIAAVQLPRGYGRD